jgi:hypothetical protein
LGWKQAPPGWMAAHVAVPPCPHAKFSPTSTAVSFTGLPLLVASTHHSPFGVWSEEVVNLHVPWPECQRNDGQRHTNKSYINLVHVKAKHRIDDRSL